MQQHVRRVEDGHDVRPVPGEHDPTAQRAGVALDLRPERAVPDDEQPQGRERGQEHADGRDGHVVGLLAAQRRHGGDHEVVRGNAELIAHASACASLRTAADAVVHHEDAVRPIGAEREVGQACAVRDRDDARSVGAPGDGRQALPHTRARRRGMRERMDGRDRRDAERARRGAAEQVRVPEVGVHEVRPHVGEVAADAAERGDTEPRRDADAQRLDAGRAQPLGNVARTDVLQRAHADPDALDAPELGQQDLGAADAEAVDQDVHPHRRARHVRSATHGSITRRDRRQSTPSRMSIT